MHRDVRPLHASLQWPSNGVLWKGSKGLTMILVTLLLPTSLSLTPAVLSFAIPCYSSNRPSILTSLGFFNLLFLPVWNTPFLVVSNLFPHFIHGSVQKSSLIMHLMCITVSFYFALFLNSTYHIVYLLGGYVCLSPLAYEHQKSRVLIHLSLFCLQCLDYKMLNE